MVVRKIVAGLGSFVLGVSLAQGASAQEQQAPPAPAPDSQEVQPAPQPAPPASAQTVYTYPTGSWIYAADRGWIWVPSGSTTTPVDGVPYTYLYTPAYGWTWYVSPWGWGGYRAGPWIAHPWRPVGWRGGWVAHPRVIGRMGGPRFGGGHRR
jgi:hypothetical protein